MTKAFANGRKSVPILFPLPSVQLQVGCLECRQLPGTVEVVFKLGDVPRLPWYPLSSLRTFTEDLKNRS